MVDRLPYHPNIKAAAPTLVTIRNPGSDVDLICGTFEPFFSNGTLKDQIEKSNAVGQRIPLSKRVKWCYQMAAAVAHTHLVAHTYHMDIKPGIFYLSTRNRMMPLLRLLLLKSHVEQSLDGSLVYKKYAGPERRNMPETTPGERVWNSWNVFPVWIRQCPKAAELAEVFSVGRSMWMLLRQPDTDFQDIESTLDLVEDWTGCEDIPTSLKQVVEKCVDRDPNKRMGLEELVAFFFFRKCYTNKSHQ